MLWPKLWVWLFCSNLSAFSGITTKIVQHRKTRHFVIDFRLSANLYRSLRHFRLFYSDSRICSFLLCLILFIFSICWTLLRSLYRIVLYMCVEVSAIETSTQRPLWTFYFIVMSYLHRDLLNRKYYVI